MNAQRQIQTYATQALMFVFVVVTAFVSQAQPNRLQATFQSSNAAADEKALTVARVSSVEGTVTMQRTTDEEWVDATLNTPLMLGDKLYSGMGGQVEVQLEDDVTIRMGSDSYIHFANMDSGLTRIGILKGIVSIHAKKASYSRPPIEVESTFFLARIDDYGNVRFNVGENGVSEVLVRRGVVDLDQGNAGLLRMKRGQQVLISGPEPTDAQSMTINQEDSFDQWGDMRDAMAIASVSRRYVSNRVSGYDDLDRHGDWINVKDYGRVWQPRVTTVEWAPYRQGSWRWRDSTGFVWVSSEPWGWVPYHYGRWVYVKHHRWCWTPQEVVYVERYHHRPYWSPALVSFTYSSRSSYFSFAIGGGHHRDWGASVGWFPLGPRDPVHRWWSGRSHYAYSGRGGRGGDYKSNNTTIVNENTYIDNSVTNNHYYQNQNVEGAVTVVPEDDFNRGRTDRAQAARLDRGRTKEVSIGQNAIARLSEKRAVQTKARRSVTSSNGQNQLKGTTSRTATSTRATSAARASDGRQPKVAPTSRNANVVRTTPSASRAGQTRSLITPTEATRSSQSQSRSAVTSGSRTTTSSVKVREVSKPRTPTTRSANTVQTRRSVITPLESPKTEARRSSVQSRSSVSTPTNRSSAVQSTRTVRQLSPSRSSTSVSRSSSSQRSTSTTPSRSVISPSRSSQKATPSTSTRSIRTLPEPRTETRTYRSPSSNRSSSSRVTLPKTSSRSMTTTRSNGVTVIRPKKSSSSSSSTTRSSIRTPSSSSRTNSTSRSSGTVVLPDSRRSSLPSYQSSNRSSSTRSYSAPSTSSSRSTYRPSSSSRSSSSTRSSVAPRSTSSNTRYQSSNRTSSSRSSSSTPSVSRSTSSSRSSSTSSSATRSSSTSSSRSTSKPRN